MTTMSRPLIAFAPLALLAACGGTPTETANSATANTAAPAVNTAATVRDLPEGQRTAVVLRAIRDAGRDCQTVTKAVEVTAVQGTPTWQATCDDGAQWIVAIGADGVATVTNRAELRETGAPKAG